MRHDAIDPCLGFYPSVLAHVATNAAAVAVPQTTPGMHTNTWYDFTPPQNGKRKIEEELPRIDATPGQLDASKPEPATVIPEKRPKSESNKRKARKRLRTYAKQQQKQPKNDVDTGSEQETSLSPPPIKGRFKHNPMRIHSPADKTDVHSRVKRKRRRPLADCLLQAAVLSGVNPVDSLIEPDPSAPPPTRKPLQFEIPDFLRHTPESQLKRRPSWTLVDPHRTTSIRTASFASGREKQTLAPSSLNPTLKPLSGWSTSAFSRPSKEKKNEAAFKHAKIRVSSSKVKTEVRYGSRRPLTLVPIEQSELLENKITPRVSSLPKESLKLTSHVIGTGIATKTSPPPLTLINVLTKDTPVIKSTNQASSPAHLPQASHLDLASEIDNIGFNTDPDPELKPSAAVAPLAYVSIPPSPKLIEELQVSPLLQNLPALILDPTLPSVPLLASLASAFNTLGEVQHSSSNSFSSPISSTTTKSPSVSTPSRPDTISPDLSTKPAKPLSSFFDEFLETVRVATSASQRHQKVNVLPSIRRERLVSSRKAGQGIDLSNAPQLHVSADIQVQSHPRDEAGDYKFDERALRTTSKVESEHAELKYDSYSQEMHNSPSMTTRDLLAVLQPSQFQIILPPLSPTPASQPNSIRSSMSGLRAFYM
ncbi:hypothetical protein C8J55DRAFT_576796 [Lentinula edodes]|uniref:Uncharacterized protein n=1 Tax=Lentinula lateritia TaxID=40482 RepID=A0A9W9E100_9AGAR|nr:hypothetical protein C8J55DRAFT_576796 [Lentinula edodes]